jgi:hypothetical protein
MVFFIKRDSGRRQNDAYYLSFIKPLSPKNLFSSSRSCLRSVSIIPLSRKKSISRPGIICPSNCSIHERNTLLILFRFTACLATVFLTIKANLLCSNPFFEIFTANNGALKKDGFFSRVFEGNLCSLDSMRVLNRQALSSLLASSLDHLTTTMRFHAGFKSMLSHSFELLAFRYSF